MYDVIVFIFILVYLPYLIFKRKLHCGFLMRLGFFPAAISDLLREKAHVWIHAVSVGEVLMVSGLIPSLKKKFPNDPIVLTPSPRPVIKLRCRN